MNASKCCVLNCKNTRPDTTLHKFPHPEKELDRFNKWIYAIGGNVLVIDPKSIFKNGRVCHSHFNPKFNTTSKRLSKNAVPSLFLSGIQSSLPLQDVTTIKRETIFLDRRCEQVLQPAVLSPNQLGPSIFEQPAASTSKGKMAPLLYKIDASPPACAVRILADIIGLELELKDINFFALDHKSSEHVKLNPMGTVPTLIDGDFVISESHATMKYLLSVYGGDQCESLYPSDVRTRALVDQCMFFNVGIFFIRLKVIVLPAVFGDLDGPTDKHRADIDEAYGIVESYLANKEYIAADHLTLADLSVGATAVAMQPLHKLDAAKFPLTAAWMSRLKEHPSFKKILVPGAEILGVVVNTAWQKNKK